jgi:hypothetical protein
MRAWHCVGVLFVAFNVGCIGAADPGLESRVAALRQEQQQREAQLYQLAQEEALARRQLEIDRCKAEVANVVAQAAIDKAQCLDTRSEFVECQSAGSVHRAHFSLGGALLGIGAAVLTGGAAVPLAAAGLGAGMLSGNATSKDCGPGPVCTPDDRVVLQQAMTKKGWSALPTCQ